MNIKSNLDAIDILNNSPIQKQIRQMKESAKAFNQSVANQIKSITGATSIIKDDAIQNAFSAKAAMSIPDNAFIQIRDQLSEFQQSIRLSIDEISPTIKAMSLVQGDTIKAISSAIDSITEMKLSIPSMISTTLTYNQYKPVSDLLETMHVNNLLPNEDIQIIDNSAVTDQSSSLSDQSIQQSLIHPSISILDYINTICAIVTVLMTLYSTATPDPLEAKLDTLIEIETKQLQLQQKQHEENVRSNLINEETNKEISLYLGQIAEVFKGLVSDVEEENKANELSK